LDNWKKYVEMVPLTVLRILTGNADDRDGFLPKMEA
jgi:hypothetical protein